MDTVDQSISISICLFVNKTFEVSQLVNSLTPFLKRPVLKRQCLIRMQTTSWHAISTGDQR